MSPITPGNTKAPFWMYHPEHGKRLFKNTLEFTESDDKKWVDNPAKLTNPPPEPADERPEKKQPVKPEDDDYSLIEFSRRDVDSMKAKAKKLGIKGYGLIAKNSPAELAKKIVAAEREQQADAEKDEQS